MGALTQLYVDPSIAGDSGTGTIGDPYGDLEYCLAQATVDSTNGSQINIKAGTPEVLSAPLNLTAHFGAGAESVPIVLRGYTATANDGGMGEIDCGGYTMFAANSYSFLKLIELEIHTFGSNHGINLGGASQGMGLLYCNIHKGASSPSSKQLIRTGYSGANRVIGCYIHDAGTGGMGLYVQGNGSFVAYNHIAACSTGINHPSIVLIGNIIRMTENGTGTTNGNDGANVCGNIVYSTVANTGVGINISNTTTGDRPAAFNNIVAGFSGAGGVGISASGDTEMIGHNAFYNNTANMALGDVYVDRTANDVALAADPFTDAANGDFSLTAAAKAALRGVGWPAAYLGAHANTDGHITIGPIQYGEAEAGGGGGRRPWLRMHGG